MNAVRYVYIPEYVVVFGALGIAGTAVWWWVWTLELIKELNRYKGKED